VIISQMLLSLRVWQWDVTHGRVLGTTQCRLAVSATANIPCLAGRPIPQRPLQCRQQAMDTHSCRAVLVMPKLS